MLVRLSALVLAVAVAACAAMPVSQTAEERIAAAAVAVDTDAQLDRVIDAIGDARVVMLGEPWHGDGGAIALRSRLVQRLHEERGFDLLVFEGDFFALHEAWTRVEGGADARAAFNEELYPFWISTPVAAPLWDHISATAHSAHPLRVAGVDNKLIGRTTRERLGPALRPRFAALTGVTGAEAQDAAETLHNAINGRFDGITGGHFARLIALLQRLESEERGPFWRQVAESARRNVSGESRDAAMGDNLLWLAQAYPQSRIIVWTHNNHALTDANVYFGSSDPVIGEQTREISAAQRAAWTYLGQEARRAFGDDLYAIATLSYQGAYSSDIAPALVGEPADFTRSAALAPAAAGTLEAALAARRLTLGFVDLRRVRDPAPVASRVLDYTQMPAVSLRLDQGYDGVLFVRDTFPLTGADR